MNTAASDKDPGVEAPPILHEDDIGSGERSPGQHETDEMIKEIPPLSNKQGGQDDGQAGQQQPAQH